MAATTIQPTLVLAYKLNAACRDFVWANCMLYTDDLRFKLKFICIPAQWDPVQ